MVLFPHSLREINHLGEDEKYAIYSQLVPKWIYDRFNIDQTTYEVNGNRVIHFRCPAGSRVLEITVKHDAKANDPVLYFQMADTFNNQLLVLMVVVNDPDAQRFNTDVDQNGNPTQFGTVSRNIPAEIAAMNAGLAPGQIRRGLRSFKESVPVFEQFVSNMGHDMFLIEPLAYHNAIIFERYGFSYMRGLKDMQAINKEFSKGGSLFYKMDDSTPFRSSSATNTIRGRAWAIHDGILGHPFTGFQMYKRVGVNAGVQTFPDGTW